MQVILTESEYNETQRHRLEAKKWHDLFYNVYITLEQLHNISVINCWHEIKGLEKASNCDPKCKEMYIDKICPKEQVWGPNGTTGS